MDDTKAETDPWERLRALPPGREVVIVAEDGRRWEGTLVPSHEFSQPRVVQLKLASGYNVGVRVGARDRIELPSTGPVPANETGPAGLATRGVAIPGAGAVALLTTGGTIASRVDYRTGGVRPVHNEREILSFYPDLDRGGPVRIVPVFDRLSEEIQPEDWMALCDQTVRAFSEGARGVVVAHGTDTLSYTAAALAFWLENLPGPVVVVGAQRSPDRPSSDGYSNLPAAVTLARRQDLGEVVVLMHDGPSDRRFAIHRGARVRKMHSSRRDAFRSRNGPPLGFLEDGVVTWKIPPRPPAGGPPTFQRKVDGRAALLWFYPGLAPERAEAFAEGQRAVVLAGTGLGHVSSAHLPWIRRTVTRGGLVVMTTQCLEGSVDPYVYATGRELLRAGVTFAEDLLPEVAYVKLLWALAQSEETARVRELLLADRAGEFDPRHPLEPTP